MKVLVKLIDVYDGTNQAYNSRNFESIRVSVGGGRGEAGTVSADTDSEVEDMDGEGEEADVWANKASNNVSKSAAKDKDEACEEDDDEEDDDN